MGVVVVDSGSSSIKYEVFAPDDYTSLVVGALERIGTHEAGFKRRGLSDSGDWEEIVKTRPVSDRREGFRFLLHVAARSPTARVAPGEIFAFCHCVVHAGASFSTFREKVNESWQLPH